MGNENASEGQPVSSDAKQFLENSCHEFSLYCSRQFNESNTEDSFDNYQQPMQARIRIGDDHSKRSSYAAGHGCRQMNNNTTSQLRISQLLNYKSSKRKSKREAKSKSFDLNQGRKGLTQEKQHLEQPADLTEAQFKERNREKEAQLHSAIEEIKKRIVTNQVQVKQQQNTWSEKKSQDECLKHLEQISVRISNQQYFRPQKP